MGKICWDFPLLGNGNESGSNIAAITMFKGAGVMDGLAREVCQNSLDAKDKTLDDSIPVRVKFELHHIRKKDYPMFEGYEDAIRRSREYWESSPLKTEKMISFLDSIEKALSNEMIPILVMSDYNTTGLRGVNAVEGEKSYWDLLVNTEGISIKDNKSSAGSYGIGKNAPFAYSALNLVFYNTLAVDGGRAFEGVARLATTTREYKGQKRKTQPIGKYLYVEDEFTGRPILPNDHSDLATYAAFDRKEQEYGTDVAVFGFKEEEYPDWETLIATAIIKNFVLALYNNKLDVVIKSDSICYEINQANLEKLLFNQFKDVPELKYTRQIYKTVKEPDTPAINVKIAEDGDLTLYVKYSETYSQSLSRFRSTGMLINTTTGDVLPHFSVVVVVNDIGEKKLSTTLREAEPPQHTEWKAKNITDNRQLHNLAAKYIREIGKAVQRVLDDYDQVDPENVVDGGIGAYLPDAAGGAATGEMSDGLMTDVKINQISRYDGRVLYNSSYETAEGATGAQKSGGAFKTGDKKRKKKKKKKLTPVVPNKGTKKGVASGTGKVKVVSADVTDHRTFYLGGYRYRLFADCPKDYDNLYIQYYATRDDMTPDSDPLIVKSVKVNNDVVIAVNSDKVGPIKMNQGANIVHVEFENHEIMGVLPIFTAEVRNEK